MKKRDLILIIVAVIIVLAIGGYATYRYVYKRAPAFPILIDTTPITILNKETQTNYVPSDIMAILNLSAYKVDTETRQLSNGGTQYVSNFKTDNPATVLNSIKSQLIAKSYDVSENTTSSLIASNSGEKVSIQVYVLSPSMVPQATSTGSDQSMIIISFYKRIK